jgi:L-lactate utilization protein LutC
VQVLQNPNGLSPLSTFFLKIYSRVATHPRLFTLSQKFAWLGTYLASPFSDYVHLPAFTGWGYSKDLPKFAGKTFRERYESRQVREETTSYFKDEHVTLSVSEGSLPRKSGTLRSQWREAPLPQSDMARTKQFIQELTAVQGHVHRTDDPTQAIVDFLQSRNINHIHLEPNVLDESVLSKAGITVSHEPDPALRVGVTKALCGLADTGSILEADGDGSPLHASLLSEIHIAVLHESDILPALENALHLTGATRSAVFITGHSRTGDIEMSHTIGVHGPKELIVVLWA